MRHFARTSVLAFLTVCYLTAQCVFFVLFEVLYPKSGAIEAQIETLNVFLVINSSLFHLICRVLHSPFSSKLVVGDVGIPQIFPLPNSSFHDFSISYISIFIMKKLQEMARFSH